MANLSNKISISSVSQDTPTAVCEKIESLAHLDLYFLDRSRLLPTAIRSLTVHLKGKLLLFKLAESARGFHMKGNSLLMIL